MYYESDEVYNRRISSAFGGKTFAVLSVWCDSGAANGRAIGIGIVFIKDGIIQNNNIHLRFINPNSDGILNNGNSQDLLFSTHSAYLYDVLSKTDRIIAHNVEQEVYALSREFYLSGYDLSKIILLQKDRPFCTLETYADENPRRKKFDLTTVLAAYGVKLNNGKNSLDSPLTNSLFVAILWMRMFNIRQDISNIEIFPPTNL